MKEEYQNIIIDTLKMNSENFNYTATKYSNIYEIDYDGNDYVVYINDLNNKIDLLTTFYEENINTIFILIYDNFYDYKKDSPNHKNINQINMIKSNAIILYNSDKNYTIETGDFGINYLEFKNNSAVYSRAYNVKLIDLHRLYISEGDNLFKDNVRKGISLRQKEKTALMNSFTDFFMTTLIYNLKEDNIWDDIQENDDIYSEFTLWVEQKLGIIYNENNYCQMPNSFWYKHNGITLVTSDKNGIIFDKYKIIGDTSKVQIVNGAQTISAWSEIFYEIDILKENSTDLYKLIRRSLLKTENEIYVKAFFMIVKDYDWNGNKILAQDILNEITIGLNTQIAVSDSEIFTKGNKKANELIQYINNNLEINIGKNGDNFDRITCFTLKNVIQAWLIFIGRPGKARNLDNDFVKNEETIGKLFNFLKSNNVDRFIKFIRNQEAIDKWWRIRTKNIDKNRVNVELQEKFINEKDAISVISANGLNHFKSFLINGDMLEGLIDFDGNFNEWLNYLYERFLRTFIDKIIISGIGDQYKPYSSNMFKDKDEIIFDNLVSNDSKKKNIFIQDKVIKLLNIDFNSSNITLEAKSRNSIFLENWLVENKYELENVRTVSCTQGRVNESFSFKGYTFTNLVEKLNNGENVTFKESDFFKEISKEYNIFIFDKIDDNNTVIKYMKTNFADGKLIRNAEEVFNIVVEAIETGNKDKLVKESDDKSFHIRPKARNAADVIMFSDNEYITKQTFWVNKAVIINLINNKAIVPREIIK